MRSCPEFTIPRPRLKNRHVADRPRLRGRRPRGYSLSVNRELRLFLLAIVLPATLFAAGGVRLLSLERARARMTDVETRRLRTAALAADFERALAEKAREVLAPLAAATNVQGRLALARERAEADPEVLAIRVFPASGRETPRRERRERGERRGESPPGVRRDRRGPPPMPREPRPSEGDFLSFETRLSSGEACAVTFSREAASSLFGDVFRNPATPVPSAIRLETTAGRPLAESGTAPEGGLFGEVPVARTNANLRAAWPSANTAPFLVSLGGCLLALLVCSLFAGGWLLLRTAHRERLDALRKSAFVDNVSHELKTPLAGIRLSAELLAEGRLPEGPRRDKALGSILSETDRLDRLVTSLLDFARLERGHRRFASEPVDLAALLPATTSSAQPRPVIARADPDAVRQILLNLLDNAAKYASEGGPPEVSVRENADGTVALEVADRGPGVPRALGERIFERFFRVDNDLTRPTGGSGLGLSIARSLARGMGGELAYAPRPGGGSLFTLTLPKG